MLYRNVLAFVIVTLLVTWVTAYCTKDESEISVFKLMKQFDSEIQNSSTSDLMPRRQPRLLNLPERIRPLCLQLIGTVQSTPKICDGVSDFVVDATTAACRESFREICKYAVGSHLACDAVIRRICPDRSSVERKIKPRTKQYCLKSLQKVVDQFSRVTAEVDREALCDSFVSGVRQTCNHVITEYCSDLRDLFRYPCNTFLPDIICN